MNFPKFGGPSMSGLWMLVLGVVKSKSQSRTGFKKSSDREAIWEVRSTSNGREATVTERAARSNPDPFSNGKGDRRSPKGLIHPLVGRI